MPLLPPLVYGVNERQPPNMLSLIVWKKILGIATPVIMQFPVMPETLTYLKQYLTTVTSTQEGGWVDDFGPAPSPFDISGTFGYNTKGYFNGGLYNGFGWIQFLEWLVDLSHERDDDGELPEVWLMSHVSQHFLEVELISMSLGESISRNMLWTYTVKSTVLRPITGSPLEDVILGSVVEQVTQTVSNTINNLGNVVL